MRNCHGFITILSKSHRLLIGDTVITCQYHHIALSKMSLFSIVNNNNNNNSNIILIFSNNTFTN